MSGRLLIVRWVLRILSVLRVLCLSASEVDGTSRLALGLVTPVSEEEENREADGDGPDHSTNDASNNRTHIA